MGDWAEPHAAVDPRVTYAPEVFEALRRLDADVVASVDPALLDTARTRVDMTLERVPWAAPDEPDPVVTLVEQFVVDVTGVDLRPASGALGAQLGPFMLALWVLDLGTRADIVLHRVFGG